MIMAFARSRATRLDAQDRHDQFKTSSPATEVANGIHPGLGTTVSRTWA